MNGLRSMSLMVTSRRNASVSWSWARDLRKTGRIRKPAAVYPMKRRARIIESFLHMIGHHPKNGIENSSSQTIKTCNALEGAYPFAEHDMDEFSLPLYWFTEKNCKEVVVKRWDEIPLYAVMEEVIFC
ncbi:MAG TPA: hypothetical protein PLY57_02640 [Deltaproteobacteria bacterium]|nr:hypothetical protein [Deltaproteobacteria bacterium]